METTHPDLQMKIDMLQLCPMDNCVYHEHLKAYEELGIDIKRFEYYKIYGERLVPYSKEYVMRSNMEELWKRDQEKCVQFSPSFFDRLKRKVDVWIWKRKVKSLGGIAELVQKYSEEEKR
ncbi:hypothetical protein [Bacillus cereus]|uniref:hypothetical protein n=1 Tax=Bacillus cereus TaxID=1396 RepID=UPI0009515318|nr:hypothetical protein [Bacillus cereus]OLR26844.1 hypothetical protein BLD50_05060 [Bacillus cereus]